MKLLVIKKVHVLQKVDTANVKKDSTCNPKI